MARGEGVAGLDVTAWEKNIEVITKKGFWRARMIEKSFTKEFNPGSQAKHE